MRKISTPEELAKRQRRNNWIIGLIFVGLLVMSTAGFSLMSSNKDSESGVVVDSGVEFHYSNGYWILPVGEKYFQFTNLPRDVENISISGNYSLEDYYSKPLYFVDGGNEIYEILNVLGPYVERYQNACINESLCENDLPLKNCSDNILIFTEDVDGVQKRDNCVYIQEGSLKTADAFLYRVLGI